MSSIMLIFLNLMMFLIIFTVSNLMAEKLLNDIDNEFCNRRENNIK